MSNDVDYVIGSPVSCSDGACGELKRVVIDPVAKALTHLVVEPKHLSGFGHLVPIELVESTSDGIHLRCTTAEFQGLDEAEDTQFLPPESGLYGYTPGQMLSFPYFGLGGTGMPGVPPAVTYDKVPLGEVEVRRGDPVHATDGSIGRVQGLVIDPADHHVTHILLAAGHLWGKKEVAIPISALASADGGIHLRLTKEEIRDLPEVAIDRGE